MANDPKQPAKTVLGWLPNARSPSPSQPAQPTWDQQPPQAYPPSPGYAPPTNHATAPAPGTTSGPPGYPHAPAPPFDPTTASGAFAQRPFEQAPHGYPQSTHAYGQSPQGYAQPPHGFGPPLQGYDAPSAPQHGFGPPLQGYDAPSAPQHGFGPAPLHTYGHSPDGYPQQPVHGNPASAPGAPGYPQAPAGYPQPRAGYAASAALAPAYPQAAYQHATAPGPGRAIPGANATAGVSDRVRFIRATYVHLLGAILAFAGLLYLLMTSDALITRVSYPLVQFALGGRWSWAIVLAVFMAVSWIADAWARHATSRPMQYLGLGIYVVAEALIFVPLLVIVEMKTMQILARGGHEPHIIRDAAFTTLAIFGALTASVVISKKDFSWMRSGLVMLSAAAMMLIVLSLVFGFNLGIVFSIAMVVLAAGYILYQTSQVLAHYDPNQHVAAALALFSSIALMFWYVIRIFLRMRQ
ncbi:MAG TPA: Bax inhibitor-1 family protein [Kofleriaceae bacterium]|nr:Bax inhibitor-1 family protein [Kofleriaceae bacterium]